MIPDGVRQRAAALLLQCAERDGFAILEPIGGGRFAARGCDWPDAFARLAEATAPVEPEPEPTPPELAASCPRCKAAAGEWCRNYKRERKAVCRQRLEPAAEPVGREPGLFDQLED